MTPAEGYALVMQDSAEAPAWTTEDVNTRARRCIAFLFMLGVIDHDEKMTMLDYLPENVALEAGE